MILRLNLSQLQNVPNAYMLCSKKKLLGGGLTTYPIFLLLSYGNTTALYKLIFRNAIKLWFNYFKNSSIPII